MIEGIDLHIERMIRWFTFSSACILFVTGAAKMISALGDQKILSLIDPVTGISFKYLMFYTGTLEIIVSLLCLFQKRIKVSLGMILWLSTCFCVYRIGLYYLGWKQPCTCLGSLTDAIHVAPNVADIFMKVILFYLLLGSIVGVVLLVTRKTNASPLFRE